MGKLISLGTISPSPERARPEGAPRRPEHADQVELARILFKPLGVQENPFGFTPNPKYLYQSRSHAEARASMIVGLECGLGFQALIAPPGMGKTTVLFDVLAHFRRIAHTAFLFQLQGDARDFLRYLAVELGTEVHDSDLVHIQDGINRLLVRERRLGRRTIIVIDEAQTLSSSVLEMIRLLSNFETASDKLLQIVLSGQPQLAEKLALPELAQLSQRISMIKTLAALDLGETINYIDHRLRVAGYQGGTLFTPAALKYIREASHGVPREINTICFNALLLLTATAKKQIGADTVREVIEDFQSARESTGRTDPGWRSSLKSGQVLNQPLSEDDLIRSYDLKQQTISSAIVHEVAELGSRDKSPHDRDVHNAEEQCRQLLQAATTLVEFHARLKDPRTEGGRRRCDGGKRPRDDS